MKGNKMRKKSLILIIAIAFIFTALSACAGGEWQGGASAPSKRLEQPSRSGNQAGSGSESDSGAAGAKNGEVSVTFDFANQSGMASNQFAIWVEDANGTLVKTLYATRFTVNGGFKNRPDSIAIWVEKAGLSSMTKAETDAVTSATPKAGTLIYKWDLSGADGSKVPDGEYKIRVEGSLRMKNYVLYTAAVNTGSADPATVQAEAEYVYAEASGYAALTAESKENGMIGPVTVSYTPGL
jgi:hypothetical protein